MVDKKTDPSLYWYLCGREDMLEGRIENAEVDLTAIVGRVQMPDDVAKLCREAATNSLSSQSTGKVKRDWLAENKADIVGINADLAWDLYLRGQIDEWASMISDEVLEQLRDQLERDGDEGSEDEPGEDGDADDDDEESPDGEDDDDEDGEDDLDDESEDV